MANPEWGLQVIFFSVNIRKFIEESTSAHTIQNY